MKAILEFNLEDQDDKMAHLRAIKSLDMALFIWDINIKLKKSVLAQVESKKLNTEEAIDNVFETINEYLYDYGINLDELIH